VTSTACSYRNPTTNNPDDATTDPDSAVDAPVVPPDTPIGPWWNLDWTRRRQISIDTTLLTGPATQFPVLVRLSPTTIDYATVQDEGEDLRFITLDHATELPFEIDRFGDDANTEVWVRVPSLSVGVPTGFWVYHGNPNATATGSGAATFAGNVSVHHLGATFADATGNGHDGTGMGGGGLTIIEGIVGRARDFDGIDDRVQLAGEAGYDFTTALSVSAWVRRQAFDVEYQAIVTKGDSSWRIQRENQTDNLGFGWSDATNQFQNLVGNVNINTNDWHHVAITFDGATKRTYVDGALDTQVANANVILTNDQPVVIGRNEEAQTGGLREWNGDIDEVRITGEVRDAAWMHAEFLTVTSSAFVTIGPEEQLP
jgi:hypothetical protein